MNNKIKTIAINSQAKNIILFSAAIGFVLFGFVWLAQAENPTSQKEIRHQMKSNKNTDRVKAAEDMRNNPKQFSKQEITSAAQNESNGLVRYRLNQALVATSGSEAIDALLVSLASDTDAMVRAGAARELGNYAPNNETVTDALIQALNSDTSAEVRYAAVNSLSIVKSEKSREAIIKAASHSDDRLRQQAAYSLQRDNNAKAKRALKKLKKDKNSEVRLNAGGKK